MIRPPPLELLVSGWLPYISAIVQRANLLLWAVPSATPTSWFRSPEENRDVGGQAESQHLFGLAVDFTGDPGTIARLAGHALALDLTPVQERDHLHIQLFPAGALGRAGVTFPT